MSQPSQQPTPPFHFPPSKSAVLPDPSKFFSPDLLSTPLPTNSFFQSFVLDDGDEPVYIHPYLIKSDKFGLSLCYPRPVGNSTSVKIQFRADLKISGTKCNRDLKHVVSSFDDLSVTLDLPSCNLRFFLVRGSPFLTCAVTRGVELSTSNGHRIREVSRNTSLTKYTIKLDNNQTWLLYSSSSIYLQNSFHRHLNSREFSGTIRIAFLTASSPSCEEILDFFSPCYPVSGYADITGPGHIQYKWKKNEMGNLLMLAHPLHLRLLSSCDDSIKLLNDFKYESIDGELVGIVGDSWVLTSDTIRVTWFSVNDIEKKSFNEIHNTLRNDVQIACGQLLSIESLSVYGKWTANAARLALIAEEVGFSSLIPKIVQFLKYKIEPWLDGTYGGNNFFYNEKWGGIVLEEDEYDTARRIKYGVYHDHHFQMGCFLYAIAVLVKNDPTWGENYRPQVYSLVADFMNFGGKVANLSYPRLRRFDMWKLHSCDGGLRNFSLNRSLDFYQDSPSDALNAYYSAALIGMAYKDDYLVNIGSMLSKMEIQAANTWWYVRETDNMYTKEFTKCNWMVHLFMPTVRIGGPEHMLRHWLIPLFPITEFLFSDVEYARELVNWVARKCSQDESVYALEAIYDKEKALDKIRSFKPEQIAQGSSITNLLWWIHSRGDSHTSSSVIEKLSTSKTEGELSSGDCGAVGVVASLEKSTSIDSKEFTYEELREFTKEFSDCLGTGGFASVYKGKLTDGKEVAVKKLNMSDGKGDRDFWTEVEIISKIKHRCLVRLLGYCGYELQRLLVYDYVPNGTLYHHLHGKDKPVMAWDHRVKVACDTARGIEYLHKNCGDRIIHRDIKSVNILLDNDFNAKVADFGFAKSVPMGKSVEASRVAGTHGYFAPEYAMHGLLTEKSDVFSFGVVLLELITGRESLASKTSLIEWAKPFLNKSVNNENLQKLVDERLQENFDKNEMIQMIKIAANCVRYEPSERPEMDEVVRKITCLSEFNTDSDVIEINSVESLQYDFNTIRVATDDFSDANILGQGGFGSVYKGRLQNGLEIVVKCLSVSDGERDRDFWTEVEILSQIKHRCLVRLLGYCRYELQRLLIYDYIPNGTLRDHLHGKDKPVMAWAHRVKVAYDTARGIEYLHEDCGDRIIHRDIKSTNILLDNDFNAKVADFGLAMFAPTEKSCEASMVVGTFGYFAPEYLIDGTLTEKLDVYSFGVVLLELITGRKPFVSKINLVNWAKPFLNKQLNNENLKGFVDERLHENFDKNEMTRMIETAANCVRYEASERPKMSEVVSALREAMDNRGKRVSAFREAMYNRGKKTNKLTSRW